MSHFEDFMEHAKRTTDEDTIQKAVGLLEDILDTIKENGIVGALASNLLFSTFLDALGDEEEQDNE